MWAEALSTYNEQPKNEALEQHQQNINTLQSSPELQGLPNSLAKFFHQQLNWLEKVDNPEQTKPQLDNITRALKNLSALKEVLPEPSGFQSFWKLISQLNEAWRQAIIHTLATKSIKAFTTDFQRNGVPTTEMPLKLFGKRFWIETSLLNIETNKESENKNIDTANIESLTEIYHAVGDTNHNTPALRLLKQVATPWAESQSAYHELKALLLSDPEQLQALVNTVQQYDKQHNTQHYETLKRTLIAADPVFLGKLNELTAVSSKEKHIDAFPHAYISSLTGFKPEMHGEHITSTNQHGDTITVDMSSEPPLRTLALKGSDYALETKSEIGALHKPDLKYGERISELNTQLTTLNLLQSDFVQWHIQDLAEHGAGLGEIKHQFNSVYGISLDFIDTLQELRKPSALEAKQTKIEQQITSLKEQYLVALDEAIQTHRKEVFEQDEKTREVLQFVSSTGFDIIPKRLTDQLIAEVKTWSIIIEGLNINPANIDLPNGKFWESFLETSGTQWKKNLIWFFNKMISGNPEWPIDTISHLGSFGKVENRTALRHELVQSGVLSEAGVFHIERARSNLADKVPVWSK